LKRGLTAEEEEKRIHRRERRERRGKPKREQREKIQEKNKQATSEPPCSLSLSFSLLVFSVFISAFSAFSAFSAVNPLPFFLRGKFM
jgi:hypothetical protein